MNQTLRLKGEFNQKPNSSRPGPSTIPAGAQVTAGHLRQLVDDLARILDYWSGVSLVETPLVSVYYKRVIAKSNRLGKLLADGRRRPNDTIVGAKYAEGPKHVITHCVSKASIRRSVDLLLACAHVLEGEFNGWIDKEKLDRVNSGEIKLRTSELSKSLFANIVKDACYVERFGIELSREDVDDRSVVTFYDTGMDTRELLRRIGIDDFAIRSIDPNTMLLSKDQVKRVQHEAPYLIAMTVSDFARLSHDDFFERRDDVAPLSIPSPSTEPVIGVIDTMFDERVYFSEWVEFRNMLDEDIELQPKDFEHGTEVSSLIVDGPSFNPDLDDGCGRFQVRHFGVATQGRFSSFEVVRMIEEVVSGNQDIKVWNLSLGAEAEVHPNFISPEAAALDRLQCEYDVQFVVAGTNLGRQEGPRRIGAPADSVNSIVVNAVDADGRPARYHRTGPVLKFFSKPDVSCFGGDADKLMCVCSPTGAQFVRGTSYAAPWIARKMAYLIQVMGFSREEAKALLIDSATHWEGREGPLEAVGFGIVPVRIADVLNVPDGEIRFVTSGVSEEYDTYNYDLPVPLHKGKHPYIARATLCYFPHCSRNQGVDYTNTEMDFHFGRLCESGIQPVDNNMQGEEGLHVLYEETARGEFGKWNNVKQVGEVFSERLRPRKAYFESGLWGMSLKTKERLNGHDGDGMRFGLVVRFKALDGENRIEEFIQRCSLRGWLVSKVDVESRIEVFVKTQEEIEFEE